MLNTISYQPFKYVFTGDNKKYLFFFYRDFDTLRNCINTELEKCEDSTPANIVDAFFKFLKKQMPCESKPKSRSAPLSSNNDNPNAALNIAANTLLIAALLLLRF